MNRIARNLHMAATAALILAGAAYSIDGHASGGNANFNVNITIVDNCKVSALSTQSGDQDTVRRPLTSGNIAVNCSKNTPAMITLNGDPNSAAASMATASLQQMASQANLSYSLNQQKAGATGAGGGQANKLVATVYGASEARQVVPVYSDVVVATVTF